MTSDSATPRPLTAAPAATPRPLTAAPAATLYAFAFLSGAAALVYQVAWTKLLALSFGRTTLAASAVVGGFMAGMGIGAWLYHRFQGRRLGALRLYACLEVGIAVSALGLTLCFSGLPQLFVAVSEQLPSGLPLQLFRVGFVGLCLLLPAALMGATYPALCAVAIHHRDDAARHLGPIYGLNTLGAAAGALVAGFLLVEQLGLRGAVWVAAALNLAVGAAAGWRSRGERATTREPLDDAQALLPTPLPRAVTGVVLLGSGFATLAYEIVWFRALGYLFGNSTYALTIMLVVFLLGLGLGGLLCGRFRAAPERNLALCQLGIAGFAMLAIAAETWVLGDRQLNASLSIFSYSVKLLPWWQRLAIDLGVGMALLLPATLLMGFSFPLATRLFLGDVRSLGRQVGGATLLANLGSILGSVTAALWILPRLGTVSGVAALAGLNCVLGFWVLMWLPWSLPRRLALGAGAAALVLASAWGLPSRLPFRNVDTIASLPMELVFEEEGDVATVQVWAGREHPERRAITVDGMPIGESAGLRRAIYAKQVLLAHLPLALDPGIRSSLNVGLGSASTLHSLASYPGLEQLDVVEISGAVARGSRFFEESAALDDPRVRLVVEDIAHFLLSEPRRYDVIVSDGKLGADFSGNALLLCRDFYEYARARLADDGIFIQWVPLSHSHDDFRILLRTFLATFPEAEVFLEDPGLIFLVGSRAPIRGRRHAAPADAAPAELQDLGMPSLEALLARWVAGGDSLRKRVGPGRISSWDRSVFDYSIYRTTPAERRLSLAPNLALLLEADAAGRSNPFLAEGSPYATSTALVRRARLALYRGRPGRAQAFAERAIERNPADPSARALLVELAQRIGDADPD